MQREARVLCAILLAFLLVLAGRCGDAIAADPRRVALVVGNSSYVHTRFLPNARHDAEALGVFLHNIGFIVTNVADASYEALTGALREFGRTASTAEFVVIYFAGHGIELSGENYLLPIDARLATSGDLEYEAVKLSSVVSTARAKRALSLLIVDACRDNPLADRMTLREGARRSLTRGLARVEPKGDFLVAFAAGAGAVAQDGAGVNSPYAEALIQHLGKPGLDIRIALGAVRDTVLAATNNNQEPVIYGALGGQTISLVSPATPQGDGTQTRTLRESEAREAWQSVKESCAAGDLKLFADRYRETYFGDLASRRMRELGGLAACRNGLAAETLAKELQVELKRVGCFRGTPRGVWRAQSAEALKQYVRRKGLVSTSDQPSEAMLTHVRSESARVCPLICDSDEKAVGEHCVKMRPAETKGSIVPGKPNLPAPSERVQAPGVSLNDCASVRAACTQVRTQCLHACRTKLQDATFGSCSGCVTSFSTCMRSTSGGACQ
jgi:hypothetical protein